MILVVTGGRSHFPSKWELHMLLEIIVGHGVTVVRTGGATGVDTAVYNWCGPLIPKPLLHRERWMPNWARFHGAAGTMRNRCMLTGAATEFSGIFLRRSEIYTAGQRADMLAAFTGNTGTMRCCEAARDLNIPIQYIDRRHAA